jgi:putative DNA primase/helicase
MGIGAEEITPVEDYSFYPATDAGHAGAFIRRFGHKLKYVAEWKCWLIWSGERWVRDNVSGREINQLVEQHANALLAEAEQAGQEWRRKELYLRARQMGSSNRREAMLRLARHSDAVAVSLKDIDADPWLAGVTNGVVDLRTGRLKKSSQEIIVTKVMGAAFIPKAKCPRWMRFLNEVFRGDQEIIDFVQRLFGYALTGTTQEQCFAFLYGQGANGKSTLVETLLRVFGDYGRRVGKNLIAKSRNGGQPEHEIAELHGCRLAVASEVAEGDRINEDIIKDISGGDTLRGCRKYEHAFQFDSQSLLLIYGNHKPDIRGTDEGIWRRVRLVPFLASFTEAKADRSLPQHLAKEADGIFRWLVEGCKKWRRLGLNTPNSVMEAVTAYRNDSDILSDFISERLVCDSACRVTRSALYSDYRDWAKENGYQPCSQKTFTMRFREKGKATETKTDGGQRFWNGIRFVPKVMSFMEDRHEVVAAEAGKEQIP